MCLWCGHWAVFATYHRLIRLDNLYVHVQIMAKGVHKMREVESVERIIELLRNTCHNGFPVVFSDRPVANYDAARGSHSSLDSLDATVTPVESLFARQAHQEDQDMAPGALTGIILRSQLLVLLTKRVR